MFSVAEKRHIADVVERSIRELNHPEMDNENIRFTLHASRRRTRDVELCRHSPELAARRKRT